MKVDHLLKSELAQARYKGEFWHLAMMFFESDRLAAGLGALDKPRRGGHRPVSRCKRREWDGSIRYSLDTERPGRDVFPDMHFEELHLGPPCEDQNAYVTVTRIGPVSASVQVRVEWSDLRTETGRHRVAGLLRAARRRLSKKLDDAQRETP